MAMALKREFGPKEGLSAQRVLRDVLLYRCFATTSAEADRRVYACHGEGDLPAAAVSSNGTATPRAGNGFPRDQKDGYRKHNRDLET